MTAEVRRGDVTDVLGGQPIARDAEQVDLPMKWGQVELLRYE